MKGFYLSIGKQGSGKTLFITKLVSENLKDRKVFSNYHLTKIPYERISFNKEAYKEILDDTEYNNIIDILEMLERDVNYFNNSIMLLDEIHVDLDSLDYMKGSNRKLQKFFSQLRKRNILLLGTTQYIMNLDVRIRRQCMNVFEMKHLKKDIFEVTTHDIDGYYSTPISTYLIDLSDYYDSYNTNEIIL